MTIAADHSSAKVAETITNLQHFMKNAPPELRLDWAAFVILAILTSADLALCAREIIDRNGMNRGRTYRSIRILKQKGLIDSVEQRGSRNQMCALYTVNGKGSFYLTQATRPNGVSVIKTFERHY